MSKYSRPTCEVAEQTKTANDYQDCASYCLHLCIEHERLGPAEQAFISD